ncbi:hypothetical protein Tco_0347805 [Tanacetum coccineum]
MLGIGGAAGAAGWDSLHLLEGDPTDDDGEDRGLLRDGPERAGDGSGEDGYAAIYSSTRARIYDGRGGKGGIGGSSISEAASIEPSSEGSSSENSDPP